MVLLLVITGTAAILWYGSQTTEIGPRSAEVNEADAEAAPAAQPAE